MGVDFRRGGNTSGMDQGYNSGLGAVGLHGTFAHFPAGEDWRMDTPQVCRTLAGMNGNSLPSEVLFNHVPFFSGEVS